MRETIQSLVGGKIKQLRREHDYWQVETDKGMISIYNPSKCFIESEVNSLKLSEIKEDVLDLTITEVNYKPMEFFQLKLDKEIVIETSLLEEDYTGPEAINIHFNTGKIIVFE